MSRDTATDGTAGFHPGQATRDQALGLSEKKYNRKWKIKQVLPPIE